MEIAVSVIIDTALITLTLALAAFGLAIIYGLIGVINMGHGAMLTLGGLGIPRNEQCDVCGKKYKKNINTLIHFAKELLGSAEVQ